MYVCALSLSLSLSFLSLSLSLSFFSLSLSLSLSSLSFVFTKNDGVADSPRCNWRCSYGVIMGPTAIVGHQTVKTVLNQDIPHIYLYTIPSFESVVSAAPPPGAVCGG